MAERLAQVRGFNGFSFADVAAEYETLPAPMKAAVVRFLDDNETWPARILEQGRKAGTLEFTGPAGDTARMVVSTLEGAMLVARPFGDITRFQGAAGHLLSGLHAVSTPRAGPRRRSTGATRRRVPT